MKRSLPCFDLSGMAKGNPCDCHSSQEDKLSTPEGSRAGRKGRCGHCADSTQRLPPLEQKRAIFSCGRMAHRIRHKPKHGKPKRFPTGSDSVLADLLEPHVKVAPVMIGVASRNGFSPKPMPPVTHKPATQALSSFKLSLELLPDVDPACEWPPAINSILSANMEKIRNDLHLRTKGEVETLT